AKRWRLQFDVHARLRNRPESDWLGIRNARRLAFGIEVESLCEWFEKRGSVLTVWESNQSIDTNRNIHPTVHSHVAYRPRWQFVHVRKAVSCKRLQLDRYRAWRFGCDLYGLCVIARRVEEVL